MKKYLVNIVLFATALLGIVACSNESEMNETPAPLAGESSISFTIDGIQPTTRATQVGPETPTPALDREKSVSELYVALFANGNLYKVLPATPKTGATYEVKGISSGTYDCYLVANPDADLVTKLNALTTASTVDNFDALIATQTPGENNTATHFLMTSAKKTVKVSLNQTNDAGAIDLVRVAARFDVYNTIAKLNMTKITFKNRYTQSSLNRGAANMTMNPALVKNSTKTYEIANGVSAKQCIAVIYGYENMTKNETVLTLEATYNGMQVKPFDIVIKDIPVKRNHLYSIVLSPKGSTIDPNDVFGSMNVNIVVVDWNVGTTLSIVGNELVNTAIPNITVTGADVQGTPLVNPTSVILTNWEATNVTVRVESEGTAALLSPMTGTGYIVTGGDATVENGKLVQTYTVALEANTTDAARTFNFTVANALDAAKSRSFAIQQPTNHPKLALEYVSEYNVSATPRVFATSHNNSQSGYYTWFEAKAAVPAGYHLPSVSEWRGIVPDYNSGNNVRFDATTNTNDYAEEITVKGVTANYTADYRSKGNGIAYALRFKGNGNTMLTAYRYERLGKLGTYDETSRMTVTVRILGSEWSGTVDDIDDETFWKSNIEKNREIIFSATSYYSGGKYGSEGLYWCADANVDENLCAWGMFYDDSDARLSSIQVYKESDIFVRPFKDN